MDDTLIRFTFPDFAARGAVVRLRGSWKQLIDQRAYPGRARDWLGEATAACVLMTAHLQQASTVAVQLQGAQALKLLFAECGGVQLAYQIRGIVRHDDAQQPDSFAEMVAQATLAVTITPRGQGQRYQGIVPASGDRLAACLEGYFQQSEQLPTRLVLAADADQACGILLQRIPGQGGQGLAPVSDEDGWQRIMRLLDTLGEPELLTTDVQILLRRLFHEESVLQEAPSPVEFRCSCSRQRVATMLQSLGRQESLSALHEAGDEAIEVQCEFCDRNYRFDAVDLEAMFSEAPLPESSPRLQ